MDADHAVLRLSGERTRACTPTGKPTSGLHQGEHRRTMGAQKPRAQRKKHWLAKLQGDCKQRLYVVCAMSSLLERQVPNQPSLNDWRNIQLQRNPRRGAT